MIKYFTVWSTAHYNVYQITNIEKCCNKSSDYNFFKNWHTSLISFCLTYVPYIGRIKNSLQLTSLHLAIVMRFSLSCVSSCILIQSLHILCPQRTIFKLPWNKRCTNHYLCKQKMQAIFFVWNNYFLIISWRLFNQTGCKKISY